MTSTVQTTTKTTTVTRVATVRSVAGDGLDCAADRPENLGTEGTLVIVVLMPPEPFSGCPQILAGTGAPCSTSLRIKRVAQGSSWSTPYYGGEVSCHEEA